MTRYISLLLFVLYGQLYSQSLTLLEDGKLWHFSFEPYCPTEDCNAPYAFEYRINGTVDYDGITYSNLEYHNNLNANWSNYAYLREDGNKVYQYKGQGNPETILYDFTLEVGDEFLESSSNSHTVIAVDEIEYAGQMRLLWTFDTPNYCLNEYLDYSEKEQWIEGIGSTTELMHPFISNPDVLSCLSCTLIDTSTYPLGSTMGGDCFLLSLESFQNINNVKVSPNPILSTSEVVTRFPYKKLTIYNNLGQIIKTKGISKELTRNDFGNVGLYFVELEDENERTTTIKVIVQ